jgi:hypothetical protein
MTVSTYCMHSPGEVLTFSMYAGNTLYHIITSTCVLVYFFFSIIIFMCPK